MNAPSVRAPGVETIETHVSVLYFLGDRVYKIKKPVRYGFIDLSTREARERACVREVELNRRLAADVYLGVSTIEGEDGEPIPAVVMRRLPAERRLSRVAASGAAGPCLRAVARRLAAFHASAETSPEIARAATRDAVLALWEASLAEMQPYVGALVDATTLARVGELARRYLAGRAQLFDARIAAGHARDGHGDVLAEDIFCLDDGPRILDCIEFNDEFRYGDTLSDAAFLAMDLERLGYPREAARFMAAYREFSGDTYPQSLVQHYVAYRALVRAKVACIRAVAGDGDARREAEALLWMTYTHLAGSRARLVLIGGLPGTGKSTLAAGIADSRGWPLVRSDVVRKELAGVTAGARARAALDRGIYGSEMTERTYAEVLARARRLLSLGESVVLDATWVDARHRAMARAVGSETASEVVELACRLPTHVAVARIEGRIRVGMDASDVTPRIAAAIAARADRWPGSLAIDTLAEPEATLRQALALLDQSG